MTTTNTSEFAFFISEAQNLSVLIYLNVTIGSTQ